METQTLNNVSGKLDILPDPKQPSTMIMGAIVAYLIWRLSVAKQHLSKTRQEKLWWG